MKRLEWHDKRVPSGQRWWVRRWSCGGRLGAGRRRARRRCGRRVPARGPRSLGDGLRGPRQVRRALRSSPTAPQPPFREINRESRWSLARAASVTTPRSTPARAPAGALARIEQAGQGAMCADVAGEDLRAAHKAAGLEHQVAGRPGAIAAPLLRVPALGLRLLARRTFAVRVGQVVEGHRGLPVAQPAGAVASRRRRKPALATRLRRSARGCPQGIQTRSAQPARTRRRRRAGLPTPGHGERSSGTLGFPPRDASGLGLGSARWGRCSGSGSRRRLRRTGEALRAET